jgi:hypothetical protein
VFHTKQFAPKRGRNVKAVGELRSQGQSKCGNKFSVPALPNDMMAACVALFLRTSSMRVNREISDQRLAYFLQSADEATLSTVMEFIDKRGISLEGEALKSFLASRIAEVENGDAEWLNGDDFWRSAEQDMDKIDAEAAPQTKTA